MKKIFRILSAAVFSLTFAACMEHEPIPVEEFNAYEASGDAVFVVNEGSFGSGNSSLSYYVPSSGKVENEVFFRANSERLGDVANSMTIEDGKGWVVVNNSGVIYAIDLKSFKEIGRITGFTSPRNIHFVAPGKAYVSEMYDGRICVVDTGNMKITGYIETGMSASDGSTEMMLSKDGYVYVNCWSYQKQILKIDASTDEIVARKDVGIQPESMAFDAAGKLWVLVDGGGWPANPAGYEAPSILRINPENLEVECTFTMPLGSYVSGLTINPEGDTLYWLGSGVWKMSTTSALLPESAFIPNLWSAYGLSISPVNGDIYVADAGDYMSAGSVTIYDKDGKPKSSFPVGVCPGAFCWR